MASNRGGVRGTKKTQRWHVSSAEADESLDAELWPDKALGESFRRWTVPPITLRDRQSLVPSLLVERLGGNGIDALGTAPKRTMPPITPPSRNKRLTSMVRRLEQHGPDEQAPDQAALLRAGQTALPALRAEFPGRLWFIRGEPHSRPPRGRNLSALCRTLVAFGEAAVPHVTELLEADDADTRYYAALVARDLAHPTLVPCLGSLLFDADEEIAKFALHMLVGFTGLDGHAELLGDLRSVVVSPETDERAKLLAIRALAVTRDERAIGPLIKLVGGPGVLSEAAWRVLRMLSLQDFGQDQAQWQAWCTEHGHEPRARWLARGLEHHDPGVREIARRELAMKRGNAQSSS